MAEPRRLRFGELAVSKGFITPKRLEEGLAQKAREPELPIGEILLDMGYLSEEQALEILRELAFGRRTR